MTYYDEIATGYEELHRKEQEKKISLIQKYLILNQDDKILDVGCGTGITTLPWKCKRYGIDPAKQLLFRAHDKQNIEYKLARAENIPYTDDFFDCVISITAIQNFEDIKKGLEEIKRVGNDKFVLTFLKKTKKAKSIKKLIYKIFDIKKEIVEDNDLIFLTF